MVTVFTKYILRSWVFGLVSGAIQGVYPLLEKTI